VFDRAKRYGYCTPDLPTFEVLSDTADDQLINKTVSDLHHVLHSAQHSRRPGIKCEYAECEARSADALGPKGLSC